MRPLQATLLLGVFGLQLASAQEDTREDGATIVDSPDPDNFVRRSGARATVLGDYVFIDGGEMTQLVNGKNLAEGHTMMNSTLWIDVSESWSPSTVAINVVKKPGPKLSLQAIWPGEDRSSFYIWGGRVMASDGRADGLSKSEMWRFTTGGEGGGQWASEIPNESDAFASLLLPQRGAYTTVNNTGYFVGGTVIQSSDPTLKVGMQPVPGMISFNMDTRTFSNDSTADISPFGTMLGGTAEYVPGYGPNGLVMLFGGYGYTLLPGFRDVEHTRQFDSVNFFDPVTKDWYWQRTTGDTPPARLDHCSVGVRSSSGTYEIFVYGGYDPMNKQTFDSVYVLSLPGFVWKQVKGDAPGGLRSGQTCVVVGNRQMLTIGGVDTYADQPWKAKDPFPQGLGIFDMTDLEWKNDFDSKAAAYDSPQMIKDWYSETGVQSVKWSTPETESLFTTASSDIVDVEQPEEKTVPAGAIAGGVVGGVAALALAGGLFWWLRRKKSAGSDDEAPESAKEVTSHQSSGSALPPSELPEKAHQREPVELHDQPKPGPPPVELE
ncbi:uncharacterized protein DNG_06009 [Cephalotrichum gorgonifer]|uniref:Kelch repeat-containing protein n=1 Tax=Cephalotrichum gorgonifer TaxID=2041049 RepID=A0AAE8N1Y1_9PEZI|nr:uncharacterized protein DNG_06009 [Cephalotrichum gorgonifer]